MPIGRRLHESGITHTDLRERECVRDGESVCERVSGRVCVCMRV